MGKELADDHSRPRFHSGCLENAPGVRRAQTRFLFYRAHREVSDGPDLGARTGVGVRRAKGAAAVSWDTLRAAVEISVQQTGQQFAGRAFRGLGGPGCGDILPGSGDRGREPGFAATAWRSDSKAQRSGVRISETGRRTRRGPGGAALPFGLCGESMVLVRLRFGA